MRIASHKVYREFVTGFGLEFYPIGGDPKVLSEFVVKHRCGGGGVDGGRCGRGRGTGLGVGDYFKNVLFGAKAMLVVTETVRMERHMSGTLCRP